MQELLPSLSLKRGSVGVMNGERKRRVGGEKRNGLLE